MTSESPACLRCPPQPRRPRARFCTAAAARRSGRPAPRRRASSASVFGRGRRRGRQLLVRLQAAAARCRRSPRGCARPPGARGAARSALGDVAAEGRAPASRSSAGRGRTRRPRCGPACSPPSRLPAPRISRSLSAICMPAPSSLFAAIGRQPLVRGLGERLVLVVEEVRVGALAAAAHPAAQLMQLREPVLVGAVDDERVRVRDVEPGLDDRRSTPARRTCAPRSRPSPARAGARPAGRGRPRCAPRAPARRAARRRG